MAHMTKMKMAAVGHMLHHYQRDRQATLDRPNIDETRTRLNYSVGEGDPGEMMRAAIEEHNANGRALRADAVVMADWVVTAPRDLREEDQRAFFQEVHDFCVERYGARAVPTGYVHMDETTPHMHQPVVPLTDAGRLQASKMLNRADLQSFHRDLGERVDERLGYHVSVELDARERAERRMNHNGLEAYKETERQIAQLNQTRAGLKNEVAVLRHDRDELAPEVEKLQDEKEKLDRVRADIAAETERLEEVRRLREGAERRAAEPGREIDGRRDQIAPEGISRDEGGIGRKLARAAAADASGALGEGRGLGERERRALERNRELEDEKEALDQDCEELAEGNRQLEKVVGQLKDGIGRLKERVEDLRGRVSQAVDRAEQRLKDWYLDQARGWEREDYGREIDPPEMTR